MHSNEPPYAHNDVKPGNVLLTHRKGMSPLAILMDFGSTRPARKEIRSRSEALQLQVIDCSFFSYTSTRIFATITYTTDYTHVPSKLHNLLVDHFTHACNILI